MSESNPSGKIRVLVVDDSALIRQMLTALLSADPAIEVVGSAVDPFDAREKIKQLNPQVLTLDVEMPKMDGVTFLANLMRLRPMPVVMVSTLTAAGADVTLRALELGAVDFVTKPKQDVSGSFSEQADEIIAKVKMAAAVPLARLDRRAAPPTTTVSPKSKLDARSYTSTDRVIAIGASTGGTEAIKEVLLGLEPDMPGIVIAQHIPPGFSAAYAERLDRVTAFHVKEAVDGDPIAPGCVYIAPGNRHLRVRRDGGHYRCSIGDDERVNRHRPSVDVLFQSMAECVGASGIGVILTGMGNDGARGMKQMREAGAYTLAQDEASSVVWGMPGEAVKLDAAREQQALGKIAARLMALLAQAARKQA